MLTDVSVTEKSTLQILHAACLSPFNPPARNWEFSFRGRLKSEISLSIYFSFPFFFPSLAEVDSSTVVLTLYSARLFFKVNNK